MRKPLFCLAVAVTVCVAAFVSCDVIEESLRDDSDPAPEPPAITLHAPADSILTAWADDTLAGSIVFSSNREWAVSIVDDTHTRLSLSWLWLRLVGIRGTTFRYDSNGLRHGRVRSES